MRPTEDSLTVSSFARFQLFVKVDAIHWNFYPLARQLDVFGFCINLSTLSTGKRFIWEIALLSNYLLNNRGLGKTIRIYENWYDFLCVLWGRSSICGWISFISDSISGAPNDGLLLNTLKTLFKQAIQSTFRALELHSKWRCKICIRSLILGELGSFWNYEGPSVKVKVRIFPMFPLSIT